MVDYTLYFSPSACSVSPHIVLAEVGASYAIDKVDLKNKKLASGGDWLSINPKGYVPALRIPSGDIITEGAVIVRYLADTFPAANLAPPNGTIERVRLDEWLHFIATELHKGMGPLFKVLAGDDYKKNLREVALPQRFATLAAAVKPYLMGAQFTVADAYAFYVMRSWIHHQKQSLDAWPTLVEYYQRLAQRPSVAKALVEEGITA
ncbi:MAG: glutathione transferase GstA [Kofleriaceae bacterium]